MFHTGSDHQGCPQHQFSVIQDRHSGVKFIAALQSIFVMWKRQISLLGTLKTGFSQLKRDKKLFYL